MLKHNPEQRIIVQTMKNKILDKLVTKERNSINIKVQAQSRSNAQNLFASTKLLENLKFRNEHKKIGFIQKTTFKNQIQSHKPNMQQSDKFFNKAKSVLFQKQVHKSKQSKLKKNISTLWQSKKKSRQKYRINTKTTQLAKFCTKIGQSTVQYELKMDINSINPSVNSKYHNNSRASSQQRTRFLQFSQSRKFCMSKSENRERTQNCNKRKQITMAFYKQKNIQNQMNLFVEKFDNELTLSSQEIRKKQQNFNVENRTFKYKNNKKKQFSVHIKNKLQQKNKVDKKQQLQTTYHIQKLLQFPEKCDEQIIDIISTNLNQKIQKQQTIQIPQAINSNLTAQCLSLTLFNSQTDQYSHIFSKNSTKKVQIASITKIMTCLLILNIINYFKLDIHKQKILVGCVASKMPGTSAKLQYSDILTVYQALHGLMLPSGNDAAVALAYWGGKMIRKYCDYGKKYIRNKFNELKSGGLNMNNLIVDRKSFQKLFLYHMNKVAKQLQLRDTNFMNPHGLTNQKSYSTSKDVSKLINTAMKNQIFKQIVKKRSFNCKIFNRTFSSFRKIQWFNTNKLLSTSGFIGVKTGVTPSAGPCLSSMYQINDHQYVIVVLLKVSKMELRFQQTLDLLLSFLSIKDNQEYKKLLGSIDQIKDNKNIRSQNEQQANLISKRSVLNQSQCQDQDDEDSYS